jgi:hypothetical protein
LLGEGWSRKRQGEGSFGDTHFILKGKWVEIRPVTRDKNEHFRLRMQMNLFKKINTVQREKYFYYRFYWFLIGSVRMVRLKDMQIRLMIEFIRIF